MAFLCSSPQIGNIAESIQLYTDASGDCGCGAYLDGAWFGGNCPHAEVPQELSELLEYRLRHLLHRAVAPSTSTTYRAGIRKYYAFCLNFNLGIRHSINLFTAYLSQTGSEEGSSTGEGCLSKRACLPILTSCLEGVAGDMVVKAEGGVEEAALPPTGVVGPLAPLELLLFACASESAGLRRRAAYRR